MFLHNIHTKGIVTPFRITLEKHTKTTSLRERHYKSILFGARKKHYTINNFRRR